MIKAVIFDIGGVLFPINRLSTEADVKKALSASDRPKEEIDAVYHEYIRKLGRGEITEEIFWDNVCKAADVEIPANYKDVLRKKLENEILPFRKVFDLISSLKKREYGVYALSNTILPHSEVIDKKGWYGLFDRSFLSHETGLRKPDRKVYEHVLSSLKIKAHEAIFVDDLAENLAPARALGMQIVHAQSPDQIVADVESAIAEQANQGIL